MSGFRLVDALGLGLVVVGGCGPDMDRDVLLPGLSPVAPEAAVPDSGWVAEPLREYGSLDGPLQFGFPYAVAVLPDGALAVADADLCAFVIVERPSGHRRGQWGGCGEGPGEFGFIRAVATTPDSLFIYDHERGQIAVWSLAGVEARRVLVRGPQAQAGYFKLSHIDVLDDSTLVVSTESVGHTSLGLLDSRSGEWVRELAGPPPIALAGGDPSILSMGGSCMRPGGGDPVAVLINEWAMEVVGIDPYTRAERFHYLTDLDRPPVPHRGDEWISGLRSSEIRCGASLTVGRAAAVDPEDETGDMQTERASMVVLEARDYNGQLRMRQFVDDKNSLLRAVPAAFRGDTLFAISHNVRLHPIIVEIVFRPTSLPRTAASKEGLGR